jgi:hypothetical protein
MSNITMITERLMFTQIASMPWKCLCQAVLPSIHETYFTCSITYRCPVSGVSNGTLHRFITFSSLQILQHGSTVHIYPRCQRYSTATNELIQCLVEKKVVLDSRLESMIASFCFPLKNGGRRFMCKSIHNWTET